MVFIDNLKFGPGNLIPVIIQDVEDKNVLMLAYMNSESLKLTIETGLTHFWSRSRKCLWKKGETSGNIQQVREILYDCDQDSLLIKVKQNGHACHTGARTCFYRQYQDENQKGGN